MLRTPPRVGILKAQCPQLLGGCSAVQAEEPTAGTQAEVPRVGLRPFSVLLLGLP